MGWESFPVGEPVEVQGEWHLGRARELRPSHLPDLVLSVSAPSCCLLSSVSRSSKGKEPEEEVTGASPLQWVKLSLRPVTGPRVLSGGGPRPWDPTLSPVRKSEQSSDALVSQELLGGRRVWEPRFSMTPNLIAFGLLSFVD